MKKIIYLFLGLLFSSTLSANNLQITNVSTVNQNEAGGYTYVQFTVSWDNSWRDAGNYDAAWIFIKYRKDGGEWAHATLGTSGVEHVAPPDAVIDAPSDGQGKGIFIYRNSIASGSNNFQNVQLKWNYQQNGLLSTSYVDLKVFGIEMVYVPQGSFYAGDGTSIPANFEGQFSVTGSVAPFNITSENAITLGGSNPAAMQNHNLSSDDFSSSTSQILPPNYPKGFNAVYCMKYETTQEQYVDFLNTLNQAQQRKRIKSDLIFNFDTTKQYVMTGSSNPLLNNGIRGPVPFGPEDAPLTFYCDLNYNNIPNENGDGQNIASNLNSFLDQLAYADWAALRPMTELEYEKVCRGPVVPIPNEAAWGNADYSQYANGVTNLGKNNETPLNGNWNFFNDLMRVGSFANSNSTRFSSGASFYGIMNLSDNASEFVISVGDAVGRGFQKTCGDGSIGLEYNVVSWPSQSGYGVKEINSVSNRSKANYFQPTVRSVYYGIRCVRTP